MTSLTRKHRSLNRCIAGGLVNGDLLYGRVSKGLEATK